MRYNAVAVDGSNMLHRAFHVAKPLTTMVGGKEIPIGAAYGFLRMILHLHEHFAAPRCIFMIAWEGGPDLHRHTLWEGYKRRERDGELTAQLDLLRERILPICGWSQGHAPGWEADDVVATLAHKLTGKLERIAIYTGDHDAHQCVNESVHVIDPNGKRQNLTDGHAWRLRDVKHRWTVLPERVPDVKALWGDTGDGVPGATGIGEVWAKALVAKHGDLDGVIAAARFPDSFSIVVDGAEKKGPAKASTIIREADRLRTFREVCTVNRDVDIVFAKRNFSAEGVLKTFTELKFNSILAPSTLKAVATIAGR